MNSPFSKHSSLLLALLILVQSLLVSPVYGSSGGPLQPEYQQVSTIGTSQLVDPFTGNLQYSIPLFEIGGFPMNLSYSSDHQMNEEAGWVGFGWTLNPGAITRQVRGLPDDFAGDNMVRDGSARPEITTTVTPGANFEVFGAFGVGIAKEFTLSNYWGFSTQNQISPSVNLSKLVAGVDVTGEASTGETNNSESATPESNAEPKQQRSNAAITPYKQALQRALNSATLSTSISSTAGVRSVQYGLSYNKFYSASGSHTFGGFTYRPVGEFPKKLLSYGFQTKFGSKALLPTAEMLTVSVSVLKQENAFNRLVQPSYGYLYLQNAEDNPKAILDYNRERAGFPSGNANRLPLAYGTPDVYSVSGVGNAGTIRIKRKDIGMFRPAKVSSNSTSVNGAIDFAGGNIVHPGGNFSVSTINNTVSEWLGENGSLPGLSFKDNSANQDVAFMHFVGEATVDHETEQYNRTGKASPISPTVIKRGSKVYLSSNIFKKPYASNDPMSLASNNLAPVGRKIPRASSVTYLTAAEAQFAGLKRSIEVYNKLEPGNISGIRTLGATNLDRYNRDNRKGHHISEIKVTNTSGQRFVYGFPLYNINQKQVTFNISRGSDNLEAARNPGDPLDYGTVEYDAGQDNSTGNSRGRDHFYDCTTTPAHPTAHLLTAVLSPDYVDKQMNGPTSDDLGQYLKIGYTSLSDGGLNQVGWRIPTTHNPNRATFFPGNLADKKDDRATYTYGEKEVAYVHHMESKTHRAVFYTSDRDDALPVDENSVVSKSAESRLQKLDRIDLYTLSSLDESHENKVPRPIKSIHFTYAGPGGELWPNQPNTDGERGKLTLQSVHFTYRNNERGAKNKYVFGYKLNTTGTGSPQPYTPMMVDRWGTQRPGFDDDDEDFYPGPMDFPYALQTEEAKGYYGIGNLNEITLPSGGTITADYEPDDYGYVHDKPVSRMFNVLGFSKNPNNSNGDYPRMGDNLYELNSIVPLNRYLHVEIDAINIDDETKRKEEAIKRYFTESNRIYFEAEVNIGTGSSPDYEKISGFVRIDKREIKVDLLPDKPTMNRLIIPVKRVSTDGVAEFSLTGFHPLSFIALKKLRDEMPDKLFDINESGTVAETIVRNIPRISTGLTGFYVSRTLNGEARTTRPDHTFVRLLDPKKKKVGGGTRVASVTINDEWGKTDTGSNPKLLSTKYTTDYAYTTTDERTKLTISSGVAANEPMVGKFENTMVDVDEKRRAIVFGPDAVSTMEAPAGYDFFPGARVGYSKVVARVQLPDNPVSKLGSTEYQFFTTLDFPVIVDCTHKFNKAYRPKITNLFSYSFGKFKQAVAQGYSIQMNDMHGKMKATIERNYEGEPISSSSYIYDEVPVEARINGKRSLANLQPILMRNDGVGNPVDKMGLLAFEEDIFIEGYEEKTTVEGFGHQVNLDASTIPPPPFFLALPPYYPIVNDTETSYKSYVTTKIITRSGVLKKVIVTKNGSRLESENHRFDGLTGQPILTSTQNEYERKIFSESISAHYMDEHGGMGAAYPTDGKRLHNISLQQGKVINATSLGIVEGDEIMVVNTKLQNSAANYDLIRAHVIEHQSDLYLVRENGNPVAADSDQIERMNGIVLKSGRANMLSAPASAITYLDPPRGEQRRNYTLSSSATVYASNWGSQCGPVENVEIPTSCPQDDCNLFPNCPDCQKSCDNCTDCRECPDCPECEDEVECTDCAECPDRAGCIESCDDFEVCGTLTGLECLEDVATIIDRIDRALWVIQAEGPGAILSRGIITESEMCRLKQCETGAKDLYNILESFNLLYNRAQYTVDGSCDGELLSYESAVANDRFPICQLFQLNSWLHFDNDVYKLCETEIPGCHQPGTTMGNNCDRIFGLIVQDLSNSCSPWSPNQNSPNPYLTGRSGAWRVAESYVVGKQNRASSINPDDVSHDNKNNGTQPLLYLDGAIKSFSPFWSGYSRNIAPSGSEHQLTSAVVRYDDYGNAVETEDALGIYSASQTGFDRTLTVAAAQNAKMTDIAYDGFEDYQTDYGIGTTRHFSFAGENQVAFTNQWITESVSHTGLRSIMLPAGRKNHDAVSIVYDVATENPDDPCPARDGFACQSYFAPAAAQEYEFSVWVATDQSIACNADPLASSRAYRGPALIFKYAKDDEDFKQLVTKEPEGPIIDGWQRISGHFVIPEDGRQLKISLSSNYRPTSTEPVYFDDLRIFPKEASMVSYAYDPYNLRLMAQLDENGYAVLYEYDDEGHLIRQKRETERGVMTISEQQTNVAIR